MSKTGQSIASINIDFNFPWFKFNHLSEILNSLTELVYPKVGEATEMIKIHEHGSSFIAVAPGHFK